MSVVLGKKFDVINKIRLKKVTPFQIQKIIRRNILRIAYVVNIQIESVLKQNLYDSFFDWISILENYYNILPVKNITGDIKGLIANYVLEKRGIEPIKA